MFSRQRASASTTHRSALGTPLRCSFCNKTEHEIKKLVAGPKVFICDECVALAANIMWGQDQSDPRKSM